MEQLVYAQEWETADLSTADIVDADKIVRRDRLVSLLLQDRNVVRILSAPHGFGKTTLAYEYASRMFGTTAVWWVQASSPDFLRSLDDRSFGSGIETSSVMLVVIDDIPYLDEQRAETLSDAVDALLYRGVEVVVTTVPSHDVLRSRQPQRILIHAKDLLVSELECRPHATMSPEERSGILRRWKAANRKLFGRVPNVFWGQTRAEQEDVLRGFFSEHLPSDLFTSVFCMLLLGKGGVEDLEHMGCALRAENERLLANDYPLFEFDSIQRTFEVKQFSLTALRDAVSLCGLSDVLLSGTYPVAQRVLAQLFARGDPQRAEHVMECFCTDEQCASWLRDWGWELLDRGNLQFMDSLFDRVPLAASKNDPVPLAMRSWTCGLNGNWREATYYARRALELAHQSPERPESIESAIAGQLALITFAGETDKDAYGHSGSYATALTKPLEFLASVVDSCTGIELARALCVDDEERSRSLESQRTDATEDRVRHLGALFTEASQTFKSEREYHLGLHFLSFVDSSQLRALVQELGCDIVVSLRRKGLRTITQALLVRDLWMGGYFGPMGRAVDRRDAVLLETASRLLKEMGVKTGYDNVRIPWEMGSIMDAPAPSVYVRGANLRNQISVPLLKVRLFGGFEVAIGDQPVNEMRWRRKTRLLFSELVLRQGRDVSRDELLDLLWPGMPRTRALDNYYNVWSSIIAIVGSEPYLDRNGDFCRINTRYVVSDVAEFEQLSRSLLMNRGDDHALLDVYARIEALYGGGLLPCETESAFVTQQRERYKAMFTDSMVAATAKSLEVGNSHLALWFARKAMEVEKGREDVYFALISAQVAAGQRCSAIRTFFQCKEFLREELGLDPSYETQELYDNLIAMDPSLLRLTPTSVVAAAVDA